MGKNGKSGRNGANGPGAPAPVRFGPGPTRAEHLAAGKALRDIVSAPLACGLDATSAPQGCGGADGDVQ